MSEWCFHVLFKSQPLLRKTIPRNHQPAMVYMFFHCFSIFLGSTACVESMAWPISKEPCHAPISSSSLFLAVTFLQELPPKLFYFLIFWASLLTPSHQNLHLGCGAAGAGLLVSRRSEEGAPCLDLRSVSSWLRSGLGVEVPGRDLVNGGFCQNGWMGRKFWMVWAKRFGHDLKNTFSILFTCKPAWVLV